MTTNNQLSTSPLFVSSLDGPHLVGEDAEESTPPQPVGRRILARPAPLVLWLLSRAYVPRSGSHRHPPAGAGRWYAGRPGGPLPGGQSLVHRQAARASGETHICCLKQLEWILYIIVYNILYNFGFEHLSYSLGFASGLLGNSDFCRQPVIFVSWREDGHQATAGECS